MLAVPIPTPDVRTRRHHDNRLHFRLHVHYYGCHPYQYALLSRCSMYATRGPTPLRPTLIIVFLGGGLS